MSWFKKLSAEAASVAKADNTAEACDQLRPYVPETFSLRELSDGAREFLDQSESAKPKDTATSKRQLISILACLLCDERITRDSASDRDAVRDLALDISRTIAPVAAQDDDKNGDPNRDLLGIGHALAAHSQATSNLGIQTLEALLKQTTSPTRLDDEVLLTLLACTDEAETWCSRDSRAAAARLIEQQLSIPDTPAKDQFLTETVLQHYLRPLFSRSKPASVTASGRKAEYTDGAATRGEGMPDESARTKPWKYTDMRAIPAVAWAVREVDTHLLTKTWPLFVPVLLALADEQSTPLRRRGLLLLADFLAKLPAKTLRDTGLASVFADAVLPTLAFLPSLTPEDESLRLLPPAYRALRILAGKQQQEQPQRPAVGGRDASVPGNAALLDKMLREGVLSGYFHARDHVRIVEVLCRETVAIVEDLGVRAVKHLKDLVPMLSAIMTDPFAPVAPATLLAAIQALQAVLANCWPRIPGSPWQDEIIGALVLCWLHVAEHERPATDKIYARIERELATTARALAAVLKSAEGKDGAPIDLSSHVAPLVSREPRLEKLFASH